jgi:putative addiction module CopG family antidote
MNVEIPRDLSPFVERMVAERRFLTASDVLAEGLRLLQSREVLRQQVRLGFEQLDSGSGMDAASVYDRAEARINEVEKARNSA